MEEKETSYKLFHVFFSFSDGGTERGQRGDSSCLPNIQPTGWRVENEIFR